MNYVFIRTTTGGPGEEPVAIFRPADETDESFVSLLGPRETVRCDIRTVKENIAWMRRNGMRHPAESRALKELRRKVRRWRRREARRPAVVFDLTGPDAFYGHVGGALGEARPGRDVIVVPPERERFTRFLAGVQGKERVEVRVRDGSLGRAPETLHAL